MKIQESAENYLETILILQEKKGVVHSIDVAAELGFSKPSVSYAMKKLRENGYVVMERSGELHLTESGYAVASRVYERHRVLSGLLKALGVNEKTALDDACRIEHVISEESFRCIQEHINRSLQNNKEG